MFIYSMRAGTLRFLGVVALALAVLFTLIALTPELTPTAAAAEEETVSFEKIRTNEERIAFLAQFGWEVAPTPTESTTVTIPKEFDKVFTAYNEIQKAQGLDLGRYKNKRVTRYTYEITNYEGYEGKVYANLIMYKNKVVAADITSADPYGFVHGLKK